MPKTFVSDKDVVSFLSPAYQFGRRQQAEACATKRGWDKQDDAFAFFSVGNATYQPRSFHELNTGLLDGDRSYREADRPSFLTLRRVADAMPEGARNTCLLVEGPRMFHRYLHQTNKQPPYFYQFASNDFMCYAAWGRDAAHPLGSPLFEEEGRSVYVGRSARGAIYASVPRFKSDLSIDGYDTHLVLVEFSILDRDGSKDDVLRYSTRVMRSHGYDPKEPCKLYGLDANRFDPLWCELERRAFEGFMQVCTRMPKELESDLASFLDQMRKSEADRKAPYGTSYRERTEKMDWQDALRSVEEPWQLEIVIHAIDGTRFYDDPNYSGALYNRVRNMLKMHECSEERRAQLSGMISTFVASRSRLWNYCGD